MKPWIRRSLFGLFGSALVAGSIAGCAGHHHHGWHDADADEHRARIVERIGSKLELDASQKGKLEMLARRLHAQRMAMRGETDPAGRVPGADCRQQARPAARRAAGRGEDRCDTRRQSGGDRRRGRLLRQPRSRTAAQGARVHGARPALGPPAERPPPRAPAAVAAGARGTMPSHAPHPADRRRRAPGRAAGGLLRALRLRARQRHAAERRPGPAACRRTTTPRSST